MYKSLCISRDTQAIPSEAENRNFSLHGSEPKSRKLIEKLNKTKMSIKTKEKNRNWLERGTKYRGIRHDMLDERNTKFS